MGCSLWNEMPLMHNRHRPQRADTPLIDYKRFGAEIAYCTFKSYVFKLTLMKRKVIADAHRLVKSSRWSTERVSSSVHVSPLVVSLSCLAVCVDTELLLLSSMELDWPSAHVTVRLTLTQHELRAARSDGEMTRSCTLLHLTTSEWTPALNSPDKRFNDLVSRKWRLIMSSLIVLRSEGLSCKSALLLYLPWIRFRDKNRAVFTAAHTTHGTGSQRGHAVFGGKSV